MTSEPSFLAPSRSFVSTHTGSAARACEKVATASAIAPKHVRTSLDWSRAIVSPSVRSLTVFALKLTGSAAIGYWPSAAILAQCPDQGYFGCLSRRSLRLAAQDVALSRRKQGFESPRERQQHQYYTKYSTRYPYTYGKYAERILEPRRLLRASVKCVRLERGLLDSTAARAS